MDTVFFLAAKLVGVLIRPDAWLAILLGAIALSCLRGWRRMAKSLSVLGFIAVLTVGMLPLGDLLLHPFEAAHARVEEIARVDGVIILGGAEDIASSTKWRTPQFNEASERLTTALALSKRHPHAKVLFAGGSGRVQDVAGAATTEAAIAKRFFENQGLAPSRILIEATSRNTAENARNSRVLAQPEPDQVWVLVTSAYHMPRAMQAFARAGWTDLLPYPVDYRTAAFAARIGWRLAENLKTLSIVMKEAVGRIVYVLR